MQIGGSVARPVRLGWQPYTDWIGSCEFTTHPLTHKNRAEEK